MQSMSTTSGSSIMIEIWLEPVVSVGSAALVFMVEYESAGKSSNPCEQDASAEREMSSARDLRYFIVRSFLVYSAKLAETYYTVIAFRISKNKDYVANILQVRTSGRHGGGGTPPLHYSDLGLRGE